MPVSQVTSEGEPWKLEVCLTKLERCTSRWRTPKDEDLQAAIKAIGDLSAALVREPSQQLRIWSVVQAVEKRLPHGDQSELQTALKGKIGELVGTLKEHLNTSDDAGFDAVFKKIKSSDAKTQRLAQTFYREVNKVAANRSKLHELEIIILSGKSISNKYVTYVMNHLNPPKDISSGVPNKEDEEAWQFAEVLVRAGCNLKQRVYKEPHECTILDLALIAGRYEFVHLLLEKGAKSHAQILTTSPAKPALVNTDIIKGLLLVQLCEGAPHLRKKALKGKNLSIKDLVNLTPRSLFDSSWKILCCHSAGAGELRQAMWPNLSPGEKGVIRHKFPADAPQSPELEPVESNPVESNWKVDECMAKLERCASWKSRWSPKPNDVTDAITAINTLQKRELTPQSQLKVWSLLQSLPRDKFKVLDDAIYRLTGILEDALYPVYADDATRLERISKVTKALAGASHKTRALGHSFYQKVLHRDNQAPKEIVDTVRVGDLFGLHTLLLAGHLPSDPAGSGLNPNDTPLNAVLSNMKRYQPTDMDWQILETLVRAECFISRDDMKDMLELVAEDGRESLMYDLSNRASVSVHRGFAHDISEMLRAPVFIQGNPSEKVIKGWLILWLRYAVETEKLGNMERSMLEDVLALEPKLSLEELIGLLPQHLLVGTSSGRVAAFCWHRGEIAERVRQLILPLQSKEDQQHIRRCYPAPSVPASAELSLDEPEQALDAGRIYQYGWFAGEGDVVEPVTIPANERAGWSALIADSRVLQNTLRDADMTVIPLPSTITQEALKCIVNAYSSTDKILVFDKSKDPRKLRYEVAMAIHWLDLKSLTARPLDPEKKVWMISRKMSMPTL